MIVPDVNLLLYAEIDAFPQHAMARAWWEDIVNHGHNIGLCSVVVFGFMRIATSRRVFAEPLAVTEALRRVRAWLEQTNVTHMVPGTSYLEVAFGLLEGLGTGSNLTTDVQIAAHALEVRGEVHSNDRDFARFKGLKWVNPLER